MVDMPTSMPHTMTQISERLTQRSNMGTFRQHLQERQAGRIKRIRVRIRGGKVQRNVRASNVKGYTLRGGKLVRMTASEKLHRKRGARRGKIKRRAKLARALLKRKRSLRRRHAMGV